MITQLQLTHFRQHQQLTLDFQTGITVIRGANESGKSTLFEAITFALFGIRACRNNDLSAWNADANSHKVVLKFTLDNIHYIVKRSARSAEINWQGGRVTGQADVSRFCEELWQLKPNTGSKLMFVGQNAMRGILAEGGVKTAQMIEQLADFDQIEQWIHILQTEFDIGKTELHEQTLQHLQQQLLTQQTEFNTLPDPNQQAQQLQQQLHTEQTQYQTQLNQLKQQQQQLIQTQQQAETISQQQHQLQRQLDHAQADLAATERILNTPLLQFDPNILIQAENHLQALQQQHQLWQDYCLAKDYQTSPQRVAMSLHELQNTVAHLEQTLQQQHTQQATLMGEINSLKQHLHTDLACPTCHRPWDNIEHMQQTNQLTEQRIAQLTQQHQQQAQHIQQQSQRLTKLHALLHYPLPNLPEHSHWQPITDAHYPPCFQWTLPIPEAITPTMLADAQHTYEHAQRQQQRWQDQHSHLQAAQQRQHSLQQHITQLQQQLAELPSILPLTDIYLEMNNLTHQLRTTEQQLQHVQHALQHFDQTTQPWFDQYQKQQQQIQQLQDHIAHYQTTIQDIQLNNQLLKALRAIKPKIANHIWQTVCSTISHYFSLMRSQPSIISKGDNGFMVDGKDVQSLSGSTLDILGIAIRIALTKTFLPHCRFLFLDEPFAACDAERQTQALGFITSIGFEQVIMISHASLTETVADYVIEL